MGAVMPWWGWIAITFICCATVVTLVVLMTRTMRNVMRDIDR